MLENKTKEMLSKEKNEMVKQLNELQHQMDIVNTQNQTEHHKKDQFVRESQQRVEYLEQTSKKQMNENQVLQRELTEAQVKNKQYEVQTSYLEKSNQQLIAELRQEKLDRDADVRDKNRLTSQIADLQAEND